MSQTPQYVQCKMRRKIGANTGIVTTGWIEKRGAKVGAEVELITDEGKLLFTVIAVGNSLDHDALRETQRQRRKPPPSIRDTKKDKRQQEAAL